MRRVINGSAEIMRSGSKRASMDEHRGEKKRRWVEGDCESEKECKGTVTHE
jgi:hypothetical protein